MPSLPARPSLEQLQKQAKDLLRTLQPNATLADAQFQIARQYGFANWPELKSAVESIRAASLHHYDRLAQQLAHAYTAGDKAALRELNWRECTSFPWDHDPDAMQRRLPNWYAAEVRDPNQALADARQLVAHALGFENWPALVLSPTAEATDPRSAPIFHNPKPPFYKIDWYENRLYVRSPYTAAQWDTVLSVMRDYGITKLAAAGISDAALADLGTLDFLTHLQLDTPIALTAHGTQHLANLSQLTELSLEKWTGDDNSFAFIGQLTKLRRLHLPWCSSLTDSALKPLQNCHQLEEADCIGANLGDGLLHALAGLPKLRRLTTGRNVTDAGLTLLREIPAFRQWQNEEPDLNLMSFQPGPIHLMIDGPFTNGGLASLQKLAGLPALSFFWHCPNFTSEGLVHLRNLPNLRFLGCQDAHCDDEAMQHIAQLPALRMLMGQGAVATAAGFEALGHSQSLEYFWGREAPNFTSQAFTALAQMPRLRGLAVSLKQVSDAALQSLPAFPALREFMPMDLNDASFRHVGQCHQLEKLWCMYCRDTGDAATEHLKNLTTLRYYYAGSTRITDRSLEILATLHSLREIDLQHCPALTTAGVTALASLPNLERLSLAGLPGLSRDVLHRFPRQVRVNYTG